jgi:glycosyltransferase involved in cell wall biosynthesis
MIADAAADRDVSVIVTAHESPESLRLVLLALARQVCLPDEALVADDGSGAATGDALAAVAPRLPFRLVRVWQPHEGFRAARGRNNAAHVARGDVLAFLDQDVLPHRGWLAAHLAHTGPGRVCIGHVLDLPRECGAAATEPAIASGAFECLHGAAQTAALAALHRKYAFYALLRRIGIPCKSKPKLRSCNFSLPAEDFRRVNGFDEDYVGWGQEDDDLGRRLYRAGVRPVVLVRDALVTHLPHEPRHPSSWKDGANAERFERDDGPVRARRGLDAHPYGDVRVTEYGARR